MADMDTTAAVTTTTTITIATTYVTEHHYGHVWGLPFLMPTFFLFRHATFKKNVVETISELKIELQAE